MLELGDNRIRVRYLAYFFLSHEIRTFVPAQTIENLDQLSGLTHLYLGKNKIKRIENLDSLVKLECLSLQSNRIVKLENLEKLVNLSELYLSENGIERIENLDQNLALTTVDLAKNRLQTVDNLEGLTELEDFWANGNAISEFRTLEKLSVNKKLTTVYFEHNPIAADPQYRSKVRRILPWLQQIDATYCRPCEPIE